MAVHLVSPRRVPLTNLLLALTMQANVFIVEAFIMQNEESVMPLLLNDTVR